MIGKLTPQSEAIYNELSKTKQMTAKTIGQRLGIHPQAAYRALKPLCKLGVVEQIGRYPRKYRILFSEDSLETYLKMAQEEYIKKFFANTKVKKNKNPFSQLLQIEFIQNRKELNQRTIVDIVQAKKKFDCIVSGHEVPAEQLLAYKQAIARGVKLRFIVQHFDEFNRYMFLNWRKLGMKVKYYPVLEARIIIIDNKIVYITSYNPNMNEEAVGARFDYAPIAKIMSEVFESRWTQAEEI